MSFDCAQLRVLILADEIPPVTGQLFPNGQPSVHFTMKLSYPVIFKNWVLKSEQMFYNEINLISSRT
jgi:hypothetical protein